MRFLDLTLNGAAENLALDEALLLAAEEGSGGELLRVWEWPHAAVVLGSGCRLAEDVDEAACRADGVLVLRRSSGGGTVLLGPGCLCFSLVLDQGRAPELTEIRSSYAYILVRVARAVAAAAGGADVGRQGTSDLTVAAMKFSGNAQQRKRHHLLHHGTLLYAFDLSRVGRYLRPPPRQPDYRAGRGHEAFLQNLPAAAGELKRRLREEWRADEETAEWPAAAVARLTAEKYTSDVWNRRR